MIEKTFDVIVEGTEKKMKPKKKKKTKRVEPCHHRPWQRLFLQVCVA